VKERLVICNEEYTDGRARVTQIDRRARPVGHTYFVLFRTFAHPETRLK